MSEIKKLHTPCKTCVFATYEEKTQVGCHAGLLDRYRSKNVEVLEAYDEEKEFYIINGKKCMGYKDNTYFESRMLGDKTLDEKADYIKSRMFINYAAVINLDTVDSNSLLEILAELKKATIHPQQIILVRNASCEKRFTIDVIKECLSKCGISCAWRTETIVDEEEPYIITLHRITNVNKKNSFTFSITSNYKNIHKIIDQAQKIVYEDFGTFEVLTNQNEECLLYNNLVYKNGIAHGVDILGEKERFKKIT